MNRNACTLHFFVLAVIGLAGCSSAPSKSEKAATPPDKIQGKAQIAQNETTATDAALNAGGPSVYLVEGMHRYRLFFNKSFQVDPGKEYIAEGVEAQKHIDEIGDPDQGKNGYPLESSCDRVVRMAWPSPDFNEVNSEVSTLRTRVRRYPARPVFLVTQLTPVTSKDKSAASPEDKDIPEISVPADKQQALLTDGPKSLPAPLWEPEGGAVKCKVVISDGKVSELDTGAQLCETVPWSQFHYQPTLKGGHPVNVKTEVEVHFDPRK
ncbi:MAG TPA: hypothetical protein VFW44_20835 [Bryobacteraceae bacterium]|nr:hypothetical protein [Bryobacteraceae bacterium]